MEGKTLENITKDSIISGAIGFTAGAIFGTLDSINETAGLVHNYRITSVTSACGIAGIIRYIPEERFNLIKNTGRVTAHACLGLAAYTTGYAIAKTAAQLIKG